MNESKKASDVRNPPFYTFTIQFYTDTGEILLEADVRISKHTTPESFKKVCEGVLAVVEKIQFRYRML